MPIKEPVANQGHLPQPIRRISMIVALTLVIIALVAVIQLRSAPIEAAASSADTAFMPMIVANPSPLINLPIPQVDGQIMLPESYCPHYAHVNSYSGYGYVGSVGVTSADLNAETINRVAIIKDDSLIKTVYTGDWPSHATSKPGTNETYYTNLHGNVTIFHDDNIFSEFVTPFDPYSLVYNPVNNYLYVSDLHNGIMAVFNTGDYTLVKQFDTGAGDLHELAVNPTTGEVYAANWGLGRVAFINDTATTKLVQAGWGNDYVLYNPDTRYLYVTHSAPSLEYPHNISVLKDGNVVATLSSSNKSFDIALNPYTGYLYVTNPDYNTVSILKGTEVIANVPVGNRPWSIDVDPATGYVFVVNVGNENVEPQLPPSVSILKGTEVVSTITTDLGEDPVWVAVDPVTHTTYIVNKAFHLETDPFGRKIEVCDPRASVTILR
jgi:YVTN family beta-propeller protein